MASEATNLVLYGGPSANFIGPIMDELIRVYGSEFGDSSLAKAPYVKAVECSRERSIGFVRKEIGFFTKMMIKSPNQERKTLLLLDAEYLTSEAQSALRRSIETHNHTTRFIMTTRDITSILKPILSRFNRVYIPPSGKRNAEEETAQIPRMVQSLHPNVVELLESAEEIVRSGHDITSVGDYLCAQDPERGCMARSMAALLRDGARDDRLLILLLLTMQHDPALQRDVRSQEGTEYMGTM